MQYQNFLAIGSGGKAVPYGGTGEAREDGEANFGFRSLKGEPDKLSDVPELRRDPTLRSLVRAINETETGILSIGCTSGLSRNENGCQLSGYVEFVFDSDLMIQDAANYFPIFFHFDRHLKNLKFDEKMRFSWELDGATFCGVHEVTGFTATVWLQTAFAPIESEVTGVWERSLAILGDYLGSLPQAEGKQLGLADSRLLG